MKIMLDDCRKLFLVVWIPVMLIVVGCICSTVGSMKYMLRMDRYVVLSWSDVLFPVMLVLVFSFVLFVLVGLKSFDDVKTKN